MDLIAEVFNHARADLRKVVLPEGEDERVLAAACRLHEQRIAIPIILGSEEALTQTAGRASVDVSGLEIIDPRNDARLNSYALACAATRQSLTPGMATRLVAKPLYFGGMMVCQDDAAAMVAGAMNPTRRVIEAGLLTIGLAAGIALPSSYFLNAHSELSRTRREGACLCRLCGERSAECRRACRYRNRLGGKRRKIAA